jgi:phosphoglycerol transferase MdoB-like AlkP superfamily enzyme
MTLKQLYRYADELPAVLTFYSWWHLIFLAGFSLLIWITRKRGIRIKKGKMAAGVICLILAALPWFFSGFYIWDPYIDYSFCNVLRINSRVVTFPGVSTEIFTQTSSEFSELATRLKLDPEERYPLTGETFQSPSNTKPNIILIISESLSRIDSERSGGLYNRLPKIDKIASLGVTLTNLIANGSNTSEALVSLFTGVEPYPTRLIDDALMRRFPPRNCERGNENLVCHAKKNGYTTIFLSNAPLKFQQNQEWLENSGFDHIEGGESGYFQSKPKGSFAAAPDQYLFDRAADMIETQQQQPFFFVLMTISLHRPFQLPKGIERISEIDFHNVLHYVDQTTYRFWQDLDHLQYFDNGILFLVGDHRRMTPLEPLEFEKTGIDSLGRVYGCILGKGVPKNIIDSTPLNLNDIMTLIHFELSGGNVDYRFLETFNKGNILGFGFPFTTSLLNLDLAQVQVRIPGKPPRFVNLNRSLNPSQFADDPQMQKIIAYLILNSGYLDNEQRTQN